MTLTAVQRGWGDPGAPGSAAERAYRAAYIVKADIAGVTWYVHRKYEPILRELLTRYVVPTIGDITMHADDWSFANRCVRGTGPGTSKPCVKSNHCLSGDTLVTTPDGPVAIQDLSGTAARLLTRTPMHDGRLRGRWVEAPVRSFGHERVAQIRLIRGGESKEITASLGHRWFVTLPAKDGNHEVVERTTVELVAGDQLATCFVPPVRRVTPSPFGIMHGVVFGDGTVQPGCGTKVTLWGAKRDLLRYFPATSPMSPRSLDTGVEGVEVRALPDDWKFPVARDASATHRAGFLAGLIATDGRVRAGEIRLNNRSLDTLLYIADLAQTLGIETRKPHVQKSSGGYNPGDQWSLAFVAATVPEWLLIRDDHYAAFDFTRRVRRPAEWRVVEVVDNGATAEVYCATVSGTGAFVLDGHILTGNSWGLAVDINATQNVMGVSDRDGQFPADFGSRVSHLMVRWGGDYTSRTDPMHFEFVGTPDDADRIAAIIEGDADMPLTSEDLAAVRKIVDERADRTDAQVVELYRIIEFGKATDVTGSDPARTGIRELEAKIDQIIASGGGGTVDYDVLAAKVAEIIGKRLANG